MTNKQKIFSFIIILLLLFGGSGSVINKEANMFTADNESYAVAGLLSIMPETANPEPEPEPIEKCECNNGIIKPDGRIEMPCPCADGKGNGTCDGCKYCKKKAEPEPKPELKPLPPPVAPAPEWYVTKITASWCGPCQQWNREERDKLKDAGFKVIDVASSGKYQVTTIPRFWIRLKVGEIDTAKNGETDDLVLNKFGYSKGQDLIGVIHKHQHPSVTTKTLKDASNQSRYYSYGGKKYDLQSYGGCSAKRCSMCAEIRGAQRRYKKTVLEIKDSAVAPTHPEVLAESLWHLHLNTSSYLADIGCGDARVLIQAVKQYGIDRAIGIEIDPNIADVARHNIASEGLSSRITIVTGDATKWKLPEDVTAVYAYLYPDLLEQLKPMIESAPKAVTPFHEVAGLEMKQFGDVYLYERDI